MLDACCGTGKSFLPMLDRGYAVTSIAGDTSTPVTA